MKILLDIYESDLKQYKTVPCEMVIGRTNIGTPFFLARTFVSGDAGDSYIVCHAREEGFTKLLDSLGIPVNIKIIRTDSESSNNKLIYPMGM